MIKDGINPDEFVIGLPETVTKNNQKSFENSIFASNLIFGHSILDYTTLEYCKISYNFDKKYWINKISARKISISDFLSDSRDKIINSKITDYFKQLDKDPLISKIDAIFSICSPRKDFSPLGEHYSYNRDRIVEIDQKRHDIIHSNKELDQISISDDDIYYLQFTDLYLMILLKDKFNISVDRYKMFEDTNK